MQYKEYKLFFNRLGIIKINYHTGNINKTEQLLLHAGLGAITSGLTGNDALTGAVSGVMGEVIGEIYAKSTYGKTYNFTQQEKNTLKEIGGLSGAISSLIVGKVQGLEDDEMADNIFNGQRLGKNAVENNLTVYVHGTFSNPGTFADEFKEAMERLTGDEKEVSIEWSGDNKKEARTEAANKLLSLIENYEFGEEEDLNIVAHSHGGNVVKEFSNLLNDSIFGSNNTQPETANVFTFATPNRSDYIMKEGVFDNYYNVYNTEDKMTQDWFGGIDLWSLKNPSQTTNEAGAINIPVTINNTYKYTDDDFINLLKPNGDTFENYFNLIYDMSKGQIENHTEMKNPETVNEIYNYINNRHTESKKNLENYNNIMNFINK